MSEIAQPEIQRINTALETIHERHQQHHRRHLSRTKTITAILGSSFVLMEVAMGWLVVQLFLAKPVPAGSNLPDPNLMAVLMIVFAMVVGFFSYLILRSRVEEEKLIELRLASDQ